MYIFFSFLNLTIHSLQTSVMPQSGSSVTNSKMTSSSTSLSSSNQSTMEANNNNNNNGQDNNNNNTNNNSKSFQNYCAAKNQESYFGRFILQFDPFFFILVMGVGIASDLLYSFPYRAYWLRVCSYIMFALASLIFIFFQIMAVIHVVYFVRKFSFKEYTNKYFRNLSKNVFWGTYPMGLVTIINYLNNLANYFQHRSPKGAARIIRLVYVLWWYDLIVSIFIAWGVSFIIWQNYYFQDGLGKYTNKYEKMAAEHLKSVLLLAIIPLVVAASSSSLFTMSPLFTSTMNRNIQTLTMIITALVWLHAMIFVFILIFIYFWSLYVYKIPPMSQVFTLFLVLGPLGQGSFGILLLTDNIDLYTKQYYPTRIDDLEYNVLLFAVPWCFKVIGLMLGMALLAMGYFFTIISVISILSYVNKQYTAPNYAQTKQRQRRIYNFHMGFWGMTFPMGTMSLGSNELWVQYNQYVPMHAFRVIGTIYAVVCILWSIYCLTNTLYMYGNRIRKVIQADRKKAELIRKITSSNVEMPAGTVPSSNNIATTRTDNTTVDLEEQQDLEHQLQQIEQEEKEARDNAGLDYSFMREEEDENDQEEDQQQQQQPFYGNSQATIADPSLVRTTTLHQ